MIAFLEKHNLHSTYWNYRQRSGNRGLIEKYPAGTGEYQRDSLLLSLFDSIMTCDEINTVTTSEKYTSYNEKYRVYSRENRIVVESINNAVFSYIKIYNLKGKLMYSEEKTSRHSEILINDFKGVYIIEILSKNGQPHRCKILIN